MVLTGLRFRRDEILDVIKRVFYVVKRKNVPMFYVTVKDLRDFTTTEKDMKKEIVRFPTPNYRTQAEDLFEEGPNASASFSSTSTREEEGIWSNTNSG